MSNHDSSNTIALTQKINKLKTEKNAVILAHYYQPPEVQEIADFVGDSLQLAQQAAQTEADVIVFCGVHFMAESAAILSPEKTVLLPAPDAGCPMADMIEVPFLKAKKDQLPGVTVVCYVNSSAEVKAECDICCTSSNAEKIINSLPDGEILFVPDGNLGRYVSEKTGRTMHFWPGVCPTHHKLTDEDIQNKRLEYPNAKVLVHPECRQEVCKLADYVGSTAGIIKYAQNSKDDEFIIGTEKGILHHLTKNFPDKKFYPASDKMVCPNMKKTNLEKVYTSLRDLAPQITVPEETRLKAVKTLDNMLALK